MVAADQLLQGMLSQLLRWDFSTSICFSLFAAWTIFHHIYFLSREGDHDVRVIGKHDFCSALPRPMLSNANRLFEGQRDTLWRLLKSASIKLSASLNISRDVLFPFEITPKRRVSTSWILSHARWSFSIHGQLLFFHREIQDKYKNFLTADAKVKGTCCSCHSHLIALIALWFC